MRLIDADALKKKIRKDYHPMDEIPFFEIMHIISNAPTVEKRPKGEWIECNPLVKDKYMFDGNEYFKCSECYCCVRNKHSFCPNCGADMRSAQNLNYADNDTAQGGLASAT